MPSPRASNQAPLQPDIAALGRRRGEAATRQTVVITGASAGVGRAIAHRFATAGARIGLIARDQRALDDVKAEVEQLGGEAHVVPADVAEADAVFAAAEAIEKRFGPLDVWINVAMVTVFAPVWEIAADEFRRVTEVTYLGYVHGTLAALRHMRPRNSGTIVQIGSALAYRGIPLQAAYCGAKHAIRGFTDSLRAELIHDRSAIRITMMELPAVNTPQFDWARTHMPREPRPMAPVVQPEVIADAVFDAVQHPSREYWIGLSTLKVILGSMLLPSFLDRYLARVAVAGQETPERIAPDRRDNLMQPVSDLHRTRGRFGAESSSRALVSPGPVARLLPVLAGGALLLSFGFIADRLTRNGQRPRRQR